MKAALAAHPNTRGVFAHSDRMASGASTAIAARGLAGQIVMVGFDAEPEGLIASRDRRLAATIYRGMYGVGRKVAEAMSDTTLIFPQLLRDLIVINREQRLRERRQGIAPD